MNCANIALICCLLGVSTSFVFPTVDLNERAVLVPSAFGSSFWLSLLLPKDIHRSDKLEYFLIYLSATALGILMGVFVNSADRICIYGCFMSYFHFSEFYYVTRSFGIPNFDAFLINHGKEYAFAFTISMLEYHYMRLSSGFELLYPGIVISIIGLFLRATAMLTAGSGFTHLIARHKSHTHSLVTHGIYAYMRHPGYCGWFLWVIGSQLILGNILSLILFTIITWKFFSERIPYEENLLVDFFAQDYLDYRSKTPFSGVLFIR